MSNDNPMAQLRHSSAPWIKLGQTARLVERFCRKANKFGLAGDIFLEIYKRAFCLTMNFLRISDIVDRRANICIWILY